jgi:CubicO group peptidase (beta-lactamase class C family)
MQFDTIFRIYSMTKPISSVALMMLYEQGLFHLTDPISDFLPEFNGVKVWVNEGELTGLTRPITVQDLLRHTAGFSYGGYAETGSPVDEFYDRADLFNKDITLEEMVGRIADLPLAYQPGEGWRYSVATDVAGRLVEVLSGMSLATFFAEKIFQPMGMTDTAYWVPPEKAHRFAALYGPTETSALAAIDAAIGGDYSPAVKLHAGGHGLVSTAADYLRFAQCLLNEGELDGARLLGRKTVELMTANHLPPALLPIEYNGIVGTPRPAIGFGLGFSVVLDPPRAGIMGSAGDYGWGGYAETYFWINPVEQLIAILMTQYMPSLTYPIRNDFRTLVYQALVD